MRNNRPLVLVDKNRLPVSGSWLYIPVAGVNPNPPAGFDSLNITAGSRLDSVKRYFYARNTTCTRLMAGRDGGALALAGSCNASLSTRSRLATPFDSEVARLQKIITGAANMAMATSARLPGRTSSRLNLLNHSQSPLTPPAPLAPLFVWRFWSCQQSRYITSTATSEQEARAQLPDSPCLFAARLPAQGVHHV
ncbi:TPA: host cell division inhibitor Icd-like protein [Salmonella enterica subsp. enterica serovar Muenchen]|nr:host cell division inhibitor Icd-like protein [Salmonella enterica subsp. enterica serovar Muenchen]